MALEPELPGTAATAGPAAATESILPGADILGGGPANPFLSAPPTYSSTPAGQPPAYTSAPAPALAPQYPAAGAPPAYVSAAPTVPLQPMAAQPSPQQPGWGAAPPSYDSGPLIGDDVFASLAAAPAPAASPAPAPAYAGAGADAFDSGVGMAPTAISAADPFGAAGAFDGSEPGAEAAGGFRLEAGGGGGARASASGGGSGGASGGGGWTTFE